MLQVTHDFAEAGVLGDVAIVLDRGRVVQKGDPADVFRKPGSPYIADFLGAENVFAGTARPIRAEAAGLGRTAAENEFIRAAGRVHDRRADVLRPRRRRARPRARGDPRRGGVAVGGAVDVVDAEPISRDESVEIVPAGALTRVTVEASGTPIVAAVTARSVRELSLEVGREIVAGFKATAVHLC